MAAFLLVPHTLPPATGYKAKYSPFSSNFEFLTTKIVFIARITRGTANLADVLWNEELSEALKYTETPNTSCKQPDCAYLSLCCHCRKLLVNSSCILGIANTTSFIDSERSQVQLHIAFFHRPAPVVEEAQLFATVIYTA